MRYPVLTGIIFSIGGFFLFSVGDVIAKYLSGLDYNAFHISFSYACVATLFLFLFAKPLGGLKKTLNTKHKKLHFYRALLSAPTPAFNFYAFAHMPMSNVYAVIFLAPFLTAVFAIPMIGEKVSKVSWAVIITGFIGVLCAMRPDIYGLSLPVIAVILTAIFTAIRNILVRKMPDETPLSLALYPVLGTTILMAIPAFVDFPALTASGLFLLCGGGMLLALGVLLTSLAFRYAPASVAAPFHYTQIVWAVVFGILVFGDYPDLWTMAGSALIVVSGLALIRFRA